MRAIDRGECAQRRIDRELRSERKAWEGQSAQACRLRYFCRAAAQQLLQGDSKYYNLNVEVEEMPVYGKGRPRKKGPRKGQGNAV